MALEGSRNDRGLYNESEPFRQAEQYVSDGEKVIADCGFQGDGFHVICPLKLNQRRPWKKKRA